VPFSASSNLLKVWTFTPSEIFYGTRKNLTEVTRSNDLHRLESEIKTKILGSGKNLHKYQI
jgi:hypothetical protein